MRGLKNNFRFHQDAAQDDAARGLLRGPASSTPVPATYSEAAVAITRSILEPRTSGSDATPTLENALASAQHFMDVALHPNTVQQYSKAYERWKTFCAVNKLIELPGSSVHVGACLALVASETASVSSVEKLLSAIAYEHRRRGLTSPTTHESIQLLMRGIKRELSSERKPMKPITHDILERLVDQLHLPEHGLEGLRAPLPLWRTVWRVVMEFYTLGRFSDIARLTTSSLSFRSLPSDHLVVKFVGGKNDIFSEGSERVVCAHAPSSRYCPVRLTRYYLRRLGESYQGFLIPRTKTVDGALVADPVRVLSYSTGLEDLREALTRLGLNSQEYGEHSGKRGGATSAAAAGMSTEELQRFGGWRSSQMPAKYTDLNIDSRLRAASLLHKKGF